eukprot:5410444-Pyramimonas_sp.AAC.1
MSCGVSCTRACSQVGCDSAMGEDIRAMSRVAYSVRVDALARATAMRTLNCVSQTRMADAHQELSRGASWHVIARVMRVSASPRKVDHVRDGGGRHRVRAGASARPALTLPARPPPTAARG